MHNGVGPCSHGEGLTRRSPWAEAGSYHFERGYSRVIPLAVILLSMYLQTTTGCALQRGGGNACLRHVTITQRPHQQSR